MRIRSARQQKALTQPQLAERAGLDPDVLSSESKI